MNSQPDNQTISEQNFKDVMKKVGLAQGYYELVSIRFTECNFSYNNTIGTRETEIRLSITEQEVAINPSGLDVSMKFEFVAPSPFESDPDREVKILAQYCLKYAMECSESDVEIDPQNAEAFGKVNGIYNAWPYLREYVQSCLSRLALPPYELPLLRVAAAAQLAGIVDPPSEAKP